MRQKWLTLLFALAALGCGTGPRGDASWPNIVIVTLDTTRADHLSLYGYFRDTTPHLDAFGEQAIVFEEALAPMATTLPSHTSLLTGTEPLEHGVLANISHGGRRFAPSAALRSFAEIARDAGYATGGFVSAAPLKRGSGIEAGFAAFDGPAAEARARSGDRTVDAALQWLDGVDAPFLLWVHTYDAHWPFRVPEGRGHRFGQQRELERWMREREVAPSSVRKSIGRENARETFERYDTALRFQDEQLGRVLAALAARPDWERTAVVIVADHGEGLSQHGHAAHGGVWHEQLHVPLVLRIPGEAPRRVEGLVTLTDVLPTLLPRLGVPALESFLEQCSGRDALAAVDEERTVVSQDTGRVRDQPGYRFSLTTPRWKYVRALDGDVAREERLFDRQADPFELSDRAGAETARLAELRQALDATLAHQQARGERFRSQQSPTAPVADPALRAQLCALGYLDEDCPEPEAEATPPGHSAAEPDLNVLLIVVDTLRRDHLGAYGYARDTSPHIDQLAAEGTRYQRALAAAPWTTPSMASLLTSQQPGTLGITDSESRLPKNALLLSELLQARGYRTGAVVSHRFVSARWGFDQGFDFFDDDNAQGHDAVTSPAVSDRAIAFLEDAGQAPFFLLLHYFDPHFAYREHAGFDFPRAEPYSGPARPEVRFGELLKQQERLEPADAAELIRRYDSEIRFTDHHIGRVLDPLRERGLLERTLVVLTADHGEEFLDHGRLGHTKTLYDEVVGVPLIVRRPGAPPGVVEEPVALVDVLPTVLQAAGLPLPDGLAGIPLGVAQEGRFLFTSTDRRQPKRAAIAASRKRIHDLRTGAYEEYDLLSDPEEQKPLADADPRLAAALAAFEKRTAREGREGTTLDLSEDEKEQLRLLGYGEED